MEREKERNKIVCFRLMKQHGPSSPVPPEKIGYISRGMRWGEQQAEQQDYANCCVAFSSVNCRTGY